jgi:hypothetical protein
MDLQRANVSEFLFERIKETLETYASYRPDIGYVQGMSYIVAVLVEVGIPRWLTFQCAANLMNRRCLRAFYSLDVDQIEPYLTCHSMMLRKYAPLIAKHFARIELTPEMYIYDWIMTCFSRIIPSPLIFRVWDGLALRGDKQLMIASVALLKAMEKHILTLDFESVAELLTRRRQQTQDSALFDERVFIDTIVRLKIPSNKFTALLGDATCTYVPIISSPTPTPLMEPDLQR